jgi:hypothetical protein
LGIVRARRKLGLVDCALRFLRGRLWDLCGRGRDSLAVSDAALTVEAAWAVHAVPDRVPHMECREGTAASLGVVPGEFWWLWERELDWCCMMRPLYGC